MVEHQDTFYDLIVSAMKPYNVGLPEDIEYIVLVNGTRMIFLPDPLHCFCPN